MPLQASFTFLEPGHSFKIASLLRGNLAQLLKLVWHVVLSQIETPIILDVVHVHYLCYKNLFFLAHHPLQ